MTLFERNKKKNPTRIVPSAKSSPLAGVVPKHDPTTALAQKAHSAVPVMPRKQFPDPAQGKNHRPPRNHHHPLSVRVPRATARDHDELSKMIRAGMRGGDGGGGGGRRRRRRSDLDAWVRAQRELHDTCEENADGCSPSSTPTTMTARQNSTSSLESIESGSVSSAGSRKSESRALRDYFSRQFDLRVSTTVPPEHRVDPLDDVDGGIHLIPTRMYVSRVKRIAKVPSGIFMAALVYLDRLLDVLPEGSLNLSNAKRVLITAVMIATKVHIDKPYTNRFWADASGTFTLEEINTMELEFCATIRFDLAISHEQIAAHLSAADVSLGSHRHGK